MKKHIALALTAALLSFPVAPGLVMAETLPTGTSTVTLTTTQSSDPSTVTSSTQTDATVTTEDPAATTVQDQNGETVDPGTLPDSPLYWFETLIGKLQVALTFDPVKKAEVVEQQAVENLAEAKVMIEKGDMDKAEKTLTVYNEKIEQAQMFLDQVKDPNSETAQKVQAALTQVNSNNMVVLGNLLEKLPPQAAQKLALNIVRSVEKAVTKAEKMDGRTDDRDNTADSTTTTTVQTSNVDNTTNMTETQNQAQLKKQEKQALEQFQVDLGLKKAEHITNGNESNKEEQDKEDQEDLNMEQQQTLQAQPTQQTQLNQSEKISTEKEHGDQDNKNKNNQNKD
ncbi:DUF5667 domain-containing protein [Desulfitobacterium metallireducens]|uniref:DUF5667 domain-containing protein n=1 Tax=Desulfitobacterium metallireducens DSM 15288 TaxID=871968 RepID=W0ECU7_9FIRM|nr:DUF5667 domain-containing protein [Desulfitobacterium metallireducens]AHF08670.1 hypothetical protein DESME_13705 [Desulfitobacterium metallireducens DSM 15288]